MSRLIKIYTVCHMFLILDRNPNLHQWTCRNSGMVESTSEIQGWKGWANSEYRIFPDYSDRLSWSNSVDPDQTPQNTPSSGKKWRNICTRWRHVAKLYGSACWPIWHERTNMDAQAGFIWFMYHEPLCWSRKASPRASLESRLYVCSFGITVFIRIYL